MSAPVAVDAAPMRHQDPTLLHLPGRRSDWEGADEEARALAQLLAQHIEELETGVHPVFGSRKPEYATDLPMADRVASKVRELQQSDEPKLRQMSRSTLHRKRRAYALYGLVGLLDGRAERYDPVFANLDAQVREVLAEVVAEYRDKSDRKTTHLISEVKTRVILACPKDWTKILPSDATIRRRLDELRSEMRQHGSARARRNVAKQRRPKFIARVRNTLGNPIDLDSTKADVWVRYGKNDDGTPHYIRPILTIAVDEASRCIVGFTLTVEAAKAVDHTLLLLPQLVTPPAFQPSRRLLREQVRRDNPGIALRSDDEFEALLEQAPFACPIQITMDRGMDFIAQAVRAAAAEFQISLVLANVRTPTDKPIVERTMSTIKTLFMQNLPGYTGGSPEYRGTRPESEEGILTLFGLQELLAEWILAEFHHRVHASLTDPDDPRRNETPMQRFQRLARLHRPRELELTTEGYIRMLPATVVAVGPEGVRVGGRYYDSEELAPLRGKSSPFSSHKGRSSVKGRRKNGWRVHYHPYQPDAVWLIAEDGITQIECLRRGLEEELLEPYFDDLDDAPLSGADARAAAHHTQAELLGLPIPQPVLIPAARPEPQHQPITEFDPNQEI